MKIILSSRAKKIARFAGDLRSRGTCWLHVPANNRSLHAPGDSLRESSGLVGMTEICGLTGIKPGAVSVLGSKGVDELQFRIKDQEYFLAFVEQEKRWYLFSPTEQGVHRIPVYVDAAKYEKPGMLGNETTLSS